MTMNRTEQEIEEIIQHAHDILSHPMTNACKFYTLYYIDKEIDVDGFDFYLMNTAKEQTKAFYNYSIQSCTREYEKAHAHFVIDNVRLQYLQAKHPDLKPPGATGTEPEVSKSRAQNIVRDQIGEIERGPDSREAINIAKQMMFHNPQKTKVPIDVGQMIDKAEITETRYQAFSKPRTFLKACEFIFGHDWGEQYRYERPEHIKIHPEDNPNAFGWHVNYGGAGWERVAKTALLKSELSKEAYVDMMWSVEHNNGNFIDKVPNLFEEDMLPVKETLNVEREENDELYHKYKDEFTDKMVYANIFDNIIPAILGEARAGNIRPLYRIAKRRFTELKDRRLREEMFPQTRPLGIAIEEQGGLEYMDKP